MVYAAANAEYSSRVIIIFFKTIPSPAATDAHLTLGEMGQQRRPFVNVYRAPIINIFILLHHYDIGTGGQN